MYIKINDGEIVKYPYDLGRLRGDNPNVSFPRTIPDDVLAEYGIHKVAPTDQPKFTLTQDPVEQMPQRINGVWTQVWAMMDVSAEEAARRQQKAEDAAQAAAVKVDTFVRNFIAMSPEQVTAYISANTGNLTQMRDLVNKMALMLLALARREYRE